MQIASQRAADVRRTLHGVNPRRAHGFVFLGGSSVAPADDGAGVAHAAPGRRGLPADKSDYRFLDVPLNVFGRGFLRVSADFANHDDRVSARIFVEHANRIEKAGADDRIATDADTGGLTDAEMGKLIDRFVGECSAAAHYANIALFVNRGGHDADFAFAGRDDARAIRTDETRF